MLLNAGIDRNLIERLAIFLVTALPFISGCNSQAENLVQKTERLREQDKHEQAIQLLDEKLSSAQKSGFTSKEEEKLRRTQKNLRLGYAKELASQQEWSSAFDTLKKTRDAHGSSEDIKELAVKWTTKRLSTTNDPAERHKILSHAIAVAPNEPDLLVQKLESEIRMQKWTAADKTREKLSAQSEEIAPVDKLEGPQVRLGLCKVHLHGGRPKDAKKCLEQIEPQKIEQSRYLLTQIEANDIARRKKYLQSGKPEKWLWLAAFRDETEEGASARDKYLGYIQRNTLCTPWQDKWKKKLKEDAELLNNMPSDLAKAMSGEQPLNGATGLMGFSTGLEVLERHESKISSFKKDVAETDPIKGEDDLKQKLLSLMEETIDTHQRMRHMAQDDLQLPVTDGSPRERMRKLRRAKHQASKNLKTLARYVNKQRTNPFVQYKKAAAGIDTICDPALDPDKSIDRPEHLLQEDVSQLKEEMEQVLEDARRDLKAERGQAALKKLKRAQKAYPKRKEVYELKAQAYELLGKPEQKEKVDKIVEATSRE